MKLKAPFPWFGGKSKVAPEVWRAIGDVDNYVEPFAGSLAVLLGRPDDHQGYIETVNDIDMYIVNFWRALRDDPDRVAYYANSPVNEADLTARHIWLVNQGAERIVRIQGDPNYYDAKVAGWWVWGICSWIGSGWCSGRGPWGSVDGQLVHLGDAGKGVNRQLVHLGNAGQGVNRQRVHLGDAGLGVNRKLVHLGDAGKGVNRQRVHLGNAGQGVNTGEAEILSYLSALAERLRYVRVCCGDWKRVVTQGALDHGSSVGIFLDPPYDLGIRNNGLYNSDDNHGYVSSDVRDWCIANGDNPRYRIVLAGYDGEHEMPETWRVISWSSGASYNGKNGNSANKANRHKERLWLSPGCIHDNNGKNAERLF